MCLRVGTFLAKEWIDKVIDVSKVSYAMIVIKVFIGSRNHYLSDLSLCLAMWIR